MKDFDDVEKALWKKAMGGYEIEETVLEYQADDTDKNKMNLVKKRVTKKMALPDSATLKILLDKQNAKPDPLENLSLEELSTLKEKLLLELKTAENAKKI